MNKTIRVIQLCLIVICLSILAGCGKEKEPPLNAHEPTQQITSVPAETDQYQDTTPQTLETVPFDYSPNPWTGTYISADSSIVADSEVLDSITMTLPEGFTRHRVSDRQIDFVRDGKQVGGFLLVDIPRDMLEKAAESREGFDVLGDYLGKQVMPSIYPSEAYVSGGGQIKDTNYYLAVFIRTEKRDELWAQYMHRIYIGEQYCYDFWIDDAFWGDSGFGIEESLACEDIKPELNEAEFAWSMAG